MNKLTITVLLAVLATVLLASGCGPTSTPTPPGESLEWEKIGHARAGEVDPSGDEARIVVVTNGQEVSSLEGYVGSFYLQRVINTDFSAYFVIAVFQGYKGSGDYSVKVTEVRREGKEIAIHAEFLSPPTPVPGQIVGLHQVITSPYYVFGLWTKQQIPPYMVFSCREMALKPPNVDFVQSPNVLRVGKTSDIEGDFIFVLVANDEEIVRQSHFIP